MIAFVGFLSVLAGTGGGIALAYRGWRATRTGDAASLRVPVLVTVASAVVAFVALEAAILGHDFSIEYVAQNTSRSTPFVFLLASAWAALEGSVVLWGLVLAGFVWWVGRRVGDGDRLGIGALAVLGLTVVFWFGLMATASNPFRVCTEAFTGGVGCASSTWIPFAGGQPPLDGFGPNPLLQNHILMAVHPPMLYVGYVGFSVPFAFAISALAQSLQGSEWLERTHRWSIVAWSFLTLGIALGAWWSYEVLGWGGYWAWDPVENAAFLPWLIATAFIHSAVVQRRRGVLQAWNLILGDLDVCADDPGHIPDEIRNDRLGAQLHPVGGRSGAAGVSRRDPVGVVRLVCVALASDRVVAPVGQPGEPGRVCFSPTT